MGAVLVFCESICFLRAASKGIWPAFNESIHLRPFFPVLHLQRVAGGNLEVFNGALVVAILVVAN